MTIEEVHARLISLTPHIDRYRRFLTLAHVSKEAPVPRKGRAASKAATEKIANNVKVNKASDSTFIVYGIPSH